MRTPLLIAFFAGLAIFAVPHKAADLSQDDDPIGDLPSAYEYNKYDNNGNCTNRRGEDCLYYGGL